MQRLDRLAAIALLEEAPAAERSRLDPMADAAGRQPIPRKFLARIDLSHRRDVGMAKDALRCDPPPHRDIAAERDDRRNLCLRKIRQAAGMPGIGDLDADGERIDIHFACPETLAGMPGAARLRHELQHAPVLMYEIMAGDLAFVATQPVERAIRRAHAGIMEKDHVRQAAIRPLAMIGGRLHHGRRIIGQECGCHAARRSFSIAS